MSAEPITRESLEARARVVADQIKGLPLAEKFRVVSDLIEAGMVPFAYQVAKHAFDLLSRELIEHSVEERSVAARMRLS